MVESEELFIDPTWVLPFVEMAVLAEGFVQGNVGFSTFLVSLVAVWGWEGLHLLSPLLT